MRIAAGLALGAACTLIVACGANKASMAPPVAAESAAGAVPPGPPSAEQRARIDALDREITASFTQLGVERPAPAAMPALGCQVGVDCSPQTMSSGIEAPRAEPSCQPGPSDTCDSTCTLADSICENASRICTIAGELGGADAYANEKCATGKSACDRASERCCTCL